MLLYLTVLYQGLLILYLDLRLHALPCSYYSKLLCANTYIFMLYCFMLYCYTHTGRAVCPTAGTEGRATIPKFTTGSFTKIVNYRATGEYMTYITT
jgi:hypothetical protein